MTTHSGLMKMRHYPWGKTATHHRRNNQAHG